MRIAWLSCAPLWLAGDDVAAFGAHEGKRDVIGRRGHSNLPVIRSQPAMVGGSNANGKLRLPQAGQISRDSRRESGKFGPARKPERLRENISEQLVALSSFADGWASHVRGVDDAQAGRPERTSGGNSTARQFGGRVALRTVQRRKCSRLAGFCERNGDPAAM